MFLKCVWGTCNGDDRYPDRQEGGRLLRFPTPKSDRDKCDRWIKACGRPQETRIDPHTGVCSKVSEL